jgi:hypothetical protein
MNPRRNKTDLRSVSTVVTKKTTVQPPGSLRDHPRRRRRRGSLRTRNLLRNLRSALELEVQLNGGPTTKTSDNAYKSNNTATLKKCSKREP